MKTLKTILTISILLNIVSITYFFLKNNEINETISNQSFIIQGKLIELEDLISYQEEHQWTDPNSVVEHYDDIQTVINSLIEIKDAIGGLSKKQELELLDLRNLILKYPHYLGYPNINLTPNDIKSLEKLGENLREVGWEMNVGYSGGWESFSYKLTELLKQEI
ncbi:hypothetical protein ACX1C1_19580 [Paenibacillus sp. strain BS8-2]